MRTFVLCSLACVSAFAGHVDSKKIRQVYNKLVPLAESSQIYSVKSNKPQKMLEEVHQKTTGEGPEEMNFEDLGDAQPGTDDTIWALASMKSAMEFVRNNRGLNENSEGNGTPERAQKAIDTLRGLVRTGVVFGYTPNGAVQCGVTLPGLLLIDTGAKKVYELVFDGSGC